MVCTTCDRQAKSGSLWVCTANFVCLKLLRIAIFVHRSHEKISSVCYGKIEKFVSHLRVANFVHRVQKNNKFCYEVWKNHKFFGSGMEKS